MFDIGWSEMAILLLVALIVIGPKDLPKVARTVGRWVGKARAMARDFQRSLEDMAREAELDEIRKEIDKVGRERIDVGRSLAKAVDPDGELSSALDPTAPAKNKTAPEGAEPPAGTGGAEPSREAPAAADETAAAPTAAAERR